MKTPSKWPCNSLVLAAGFLALCPAASQADSLYREGQFTSLTADIKAHAVGDILTIVVQESNTASKNNSTSTSKKTGVDASISSFLYPASASKALTKNGSLPAMKFDSANTFDGGGKINNSEQLTARIAVRVVDVLPNKTMVIEGTRQITFAGETQEAVLRGVVRSDDVSPANTVFSYNVADTTIKYVSRGAVSDSQKKGFFTKIWDKIGPF
jgi:flagellar L-ring protein precursor FlgH